MRVMGIQSGNAVDGIDVGIFDFEPPVRSSIDPRALAGSLEYTTVANKTQTCSAFCLLTGGERRLWMWAQQVCHASSDRKNDDRYEEHLSPRREHTMIGALFLLLSLSPKGISAPEARTRAAPSWVVLKNTGIDAGR